MDRLNYTYRDGTNQLWSVQDGIAAGAYTGDIDNQGGSNYSYDRIANLIGDVSENISQVNWTVYGKIGNIQKKQAFLGYVYNAGGERVVKQYLPYATNQCLGCDENTGMVDLEVYERNSNTPNIYKASKTITFLSEYTDVRYNEYTAIIEAGLALCTPQCNVQPPLTTSDADIYIRDATGNTLAVYHYDRKTSQLRWSEQHLYGSARLGMYLPEKSVTSVSTDSKQREVGYLGKQVFELSNHLGNVLATITDKKLQVSLNTTSTAYFEADVQIVQDYYAFGMQMPGRKLSGGYRYGFNGKENDNEVKGEGNQQDYGMRIYDGRIGKFLSTDPLAKKYPELSAYQFASNSPIENSDLDGAEAISEIKSGLARKMEMRVFSVSMKDAKTKVKENQIRALLYYYATNPNAHAKQSISEAPKEVSDRVRQLRREHFQDPDTGEKTAVGRFFENSHYEKFNDNIVTPMAEATIGEGAGKLLFKGGSATFKLLAPKISPVAEVGSNMSITKYYPLNGGALGKWESEFLLTGTEIDRAGSGFGKYFSPRGTPMDMRALPPDNNGVFNAFRVLKPFEVQSSTIAPAFDKIGLGKQYLSPVNLNTLLKRGIVEPIKK